MKHEIWEYLFDKFLITASLSALQAWTLFDQVKGKLLQNHVLYQVTRETNVICATSCFRSTKCFSFNFNKETKVCQKNSATHHLHPTDFVTNTDPAFVYHYRKPT